MSGLELGTSMPMVPRPGMGAMIRIPRAAKLRAMSSSRFLIFEMRIPGAGTISYSVTVGPTSAVMLDTSMLKLRSVSMMRVLLASNSASDTLTLPSPCWTRRSMFGNSKRLRSSVGSYSPKSCTFLSISSPVNWVSSSTCLTSKVTPSSSAVAGSSAATGAAGAGSGSGAGGGRGASAAGGSASSW